MIRLVVCGPLDGQHAREAIREAIRRRWTEGRIRAETVDRLLSGAPLCAVLAYASGRLIGVSVCGAETSMTAVDPDWRSRGIGRAMLWLRSGLPGAVVEARIAPTNEPSRRMAAGAGWAPSGEATWCRDG